MPIINGKVCVVNGKPVDKVYSNGKQVYGRNLWIRSRAVEGYLDPNHTGEVIAPDSENLVSDFISIDGNQTYVYSTDVVITVSIKLQTLDYYQFFDSNKVPFGGRNSQLGPFVDLGTPQHTELVIKAPVGASFIRIGSRYLEHGTVKLQKGSVATPWTPAPEDVGAVVQSA